MLCLGSQNPSLLAGEKAEMQQVIYSSSITVIKYIY